MSGLLTVSLPSRQPAVAISAARGQARRGSDGPSAAAIGFDTVLAGHAAPLKPSQAKTPAAPAAQTPGADRQGARHAADQVATAGPALKRTRTDAARRGDAAPNSATDVPPASSPVAAEPAPQMMAQVAPAGSPAAVDAAGTISGEANPASGVGVPTVAGTGAAPAPSTAVPPATLSTQPGAAAQAPDPGATGTHPEVGTGHPGAVPGQSGPGATSAGAPLPAQAVVVASAATPAQPNQGTEGAGDGEAPTAATLGVVPATSIPLRPAPSAPGAPALAVGNQDAEANPAVVAGDVATGDAASAPGQTGPGGTRVGPVALGQPVVAPAASTPIPPAAASTIPGATAPVPGTGAPDTIPAGSGDPGAIPGQTSPETTSPAAHLPGQPVVVAPAATSTQPHQGTDAAGAGGAPTPPVLGVVPVLTSAVPPPLAWTAPTAPATGQQTPISLPAAAHQQVFTAVSPLLRGADGSYGLHLQLHPKDLGAVQVTVDVRHGEISIQMHATDPAARDALRSGLSDLRQQLEDQGLRAGSMEVGSGGANARQPETSWSTSHGNEEPRRPVVPTERLGATAAAASSTTLDLRM